MSGWQEGDAVIAEALIPRDDRQALRERLRYEHAIERIVVVAGQLPRCDPVSDCYRQGRKTPAWT